MSQLQQIPVPFPIGGVNTGTGLSDQPQGTCPNAQNMRLFGTLDKRTRGGQRPGLVKSFDANLASAVSLVSFTDGAGNDDEFIIAGDRSAEFAVGRTLVIAGSTSNDGTYTTISAATYDVGDDETTVFVPTASWTDEVLGSATVTSQPIGEAIEEVIVAEFILDQTADLAITPIQTDNFSLADGWLDLDKLSQASPPARIPQYWSEHQEVGSASPTLRQDGLAQWTIQNDSPGAALMCEYNLASNTERAVLIDQAQAVLGSNYDVFLTIVGQGTGGGGITYGFPSRTEMISLPNINFGIFFRVKADRTEFLYATVTSSWSSSGTFQTGVLRHRSGGTNSSVGSDFTNTLTNKDVFPDSDFPAAAMEFWIKVRGNTIEQFIKLDTQASWTIIGQWLGVSELSGEIGVGFGVIGNKQYAVDKFEVGSATVGPYGRRNQLVVAFGNSQVWTGQINQDTNLKRVTAGANAPLAGNIQAVQLFGRVYAMDGTTARIIEGELSGPVSAPLDQGTKTIVNYATACTDFDATSVIPGDIIGITSYRGCIILYGQTSDPNNWYASAVAEPLDWRFGIDPFETAAFAADNSDFGRNPDPIFAMIPWHDDLMLIGGSHSIRQLTGDPRLGGQIDVITDSIGILGFNAWAIGKGGVVYFMGSDGFYVMPFGSQPQNLSKGKLDDLLGNVSIGNVQVIVRYDPFASGVHIWLTPINPGDPGVHVFFDELVGGFWPFVYATNAHQPYAAATLYGNAADDQTVLLGCQDGFIRQHDDASANDDGVAIDAFVEYAPFFAGQGLQEGVIRELQAEAATGGGDIAWTLRGAQSAQELADGTLQFGSRTGTIVETGFARPQRLSLRFGAGSLKIRNATLGETFSVERMLIRHKGGGRRRRFGAIT